MMSWIEDILRCKSLSIIGLEKNTGKTESLNYILQELKDSGRTIALTSIGIDSEAGNRTLRRHGFRNDRATLSNKTVGSRGAGYQ